MRGKRTRYTFVIEFMGGTYVHQALGESPELALKSCLRVAEDDCEWTSHRAEILTAIEDRPAVLIEGCLNVWCMSGIADEELFLIHIVATDSDSSRGRTLLERQRLEEIGNAAKNWG